MLRAGVRAEQLAVEHVRKPGERMPVAGMNGGEGPAEAGQRQAAFDERVFGDVVRVVVTHKRVGADGQEHHQRGKREQKGDEART